MVTRRGLVLGAGAGLALAALPSAYAQYRPVITVYKSPTCGCCGEWEKHMRESGFRLETNPIADVTPLKRKYGVPEAAYSCHTATIASACCASVPKSPGSPSPAWCRARQG